MLFALGKLTLKLIKTDSSPGYSPVSMWLPPSQGFPKELHEDMKATLEDGAPSYSTEKKWDAALRRCRER